jgi:8-oxo-dGTP diphosphatase
MRMSNRNIATGNAHVGVQAGQIYGNVTVGTGADRPIDLAASIADLRTHIKQAHLDGQLDEETYAAAESELQAATACVSAGTPEKKSGLMVALKRLWGLVADVSELAARLAAIIAVVRGMA